MSLQQFLSLPGAGDPGPASADAAGARDTADPGGFPGLLATLAAVPPQPVANPAVSAGIDPPGSAAGPEPSGSVAGPPLPGSAAITAAPAGTDLPPPGTELPPREGLPAAIAAPVRADADAHASRYRESPPFSIAESAGPPKAAPAQLSEQAAARPAVSGQVPHRVVSPVPAPTESPSLPADELPVAARPERNATAAQAQQALQHPLPPPVPRAPARPQPRSGAPATGDEPTLKPIPAAIQASRQAVATGGTEPRAEASRSGAGNLPNALSRPQLPPSRLPGELRMPDVRPVAPAPTGPELEPPVAVAHPVDRAEKVEQPLPRAAVTGAEVPAAKPDMLAGKPDLPAAKPEAATVVQGAASPEFARAEVSVDRMPPTTAVAQGWSASSPNDSSASGRAGSVPVFDIAASMTEPRWQEALGHRVTMLAGRNIGSAELRLNPAELGPVQVQISVEDNVAKVLFSAVHGQTREQLELAMPRLRDMFAEQGITLGDASVSAEGRDRDETRSDGDTVAREIAPPEAAAHQAADRIAAGRGVLAPGRVDTYA